MNQWSQEQMLTKERESVGLTTGWDELGFTYLNLVVNNKSG